MRSPFPSKHSYIDFMRLALRQSSFDGLLLFRDSQQREQQQRKGLTESPGKSGRWFIISAKMQPIDQMSTGVE